MKEEFTRVQKGDVAAFKIVFEHYFERLVKYSHSYTNDHEASKDIVQEVFMKVWDKRKSIRVETFDNYLYRAAHNKTLNYLRDNKKTIPFEMLNENYHTTQDSVKNNFRETESIQLLNAIADLPKKCKEIFIKTKLDGQTYKQTAKELDLAEKTVERQVGIGFKKIREYFRINK